MNAPSLAQMLAEPRYLPQEVDFQRGQVRFTPTTQERLERTSFLDGRVDIADGETVTVPLNAVLAQAARLAPADGRDRMIFHVSFCGSTLLARMLSVPGASFALKEPNALAWLADWKKAGRQDDPHFAAALAWIRASHRRRWHAGEPVLVKPSNWANNLLPELTADPGAIRPLFVTMARRPFLIAVLRGGRDRLAFTARAASHLIRGDEEQGWLGAAIVASRDPLAITVHIAAVTLQVQMNAFAAAMRAGGWGGDHVLDAAAVTGDPVAAALAAARALDLAIAPDKLAAHAAAVSGANAKDPARAFTAADRRGEDDEIERHHGALLDTVEDWAGRVLGPHPRLG